MKQIVIMLLAGLFITGLAFAESKLVINELSGNAKVINGSKINKAQLEMPLEMSSLIKTFKNARVVIKDTATGKTYVINENRVVSVSKLLGKKDSSRIMGVISRLSKTSGTPFSSVSVIAAVRGDEMGKKGKKFKVQYSGTQSTPQTAKIDFYKRGKEAYKSSDFEKAISDFSTYIAEPGVHGEKMENAYFYIVASHVELLEYDQAYSKIDNALTIVNDPEKRAGLLYDKAVIALNRDDGNAFSTVIKTFYAEHKASTLYWQLRAMHMYYLLEKGKNEEAAKIKIDIIDNSDNKELVEEINNAQT